MTELKITGENYQREVMEADRPVLIDFWATWCGPCRMLAPVVEEIAKEHPEIKVGKVNVDDEPELASAFRVASIPTVVVLKKGKVVNRAVGYRPKSELLKLIEV